MDDHNTMNLTYIIMCNSRYRRNGDTGALHGYGVEGKPVARYAESGILVDSTILMNSGSA